MGCASVEYRPRGSGAPGFEDERLGARTWVVRVGPGWPNEMPRLRHFALYRSAEIATTHGARYFAIIDGVDATGDTALYAPDAPMPEPIGPGPVSDPTWTQRYLGTGIGPRSSVAFRFRLLTQSEVAAHDVVLDAHKVLARLARVVGR